MELVICQSCGQILRGRSKFCNGCGIPTTKFSPTPLATFQDKATPLAVTQKLEPLVLERTVNKIIYGNGNGNGAKRIAVPPPTDSQISVQEPAAQAPSGTKDLLDPLSMPASVLENYNLQDIANATLIGSQAAFQALQTLQKTEPNPPHKESEKQNELENTNNDFIQNELWNEEQPQANSDENPGENQIEAVESTAINPISEKSVADQTFAAAEPESSKNPVPEELQGKPLSQEPVQIAAPEAQANEEDRTGITDFFTAAPPKPAVRLDEEEQLPTVPSVSPSPSQSADPAGITLPPSSAQSQAQNIPASNAFKEATPDTNQNPATPISPPINHSTNTAVPTNKSSYSDFFAETSVSNSASATRNDPYSSATSEVEYQRAAQTAAPGIVSASPVPADSEQVSIIQNAIQAAIDSQNNPEKSEVSEPTSQTSRPSKDKDKSSSRKRSATNNGEEKAAADRDEQSAELKELVKRKSGANKTKKQSDTDTESTKINAKPGLRNRKQNEESKKVNIMGFSVPLNMLMIGSVVCVFGFALIVLVSTLGSILGGLPNITANIQGQQQSSSDLNSLSGKWNFAYSNPNQSIGRGILNLTQSGDQIQGWGVDKAQFSINGTYKNGTMQFNKQYLQGGQPIGKPILYQGRIDGINANPQPGQPYAHVSGVWQLVKREGFSWRAQIVTLQGRWEAALSEKGQSMSSAENIKVTPGNLTLSTEKDPKKPQAFFMQVAIGIVIFCIFLATASLKIFGRSGVLNIMEKKEYIPSQFKSQNKKMVREMGKPLKAGSLPLGTREEWNIFQFWMPKSLNLPSNLREQNPHVLILGAGAKGKSRLMASMIAHDIESNDRAVIVIDSDGTLVDLLVSWVGAHPKAKEMAERMIVIDPTQEKPTLSYNPLEMPDDGDLQNAASAVVFGFKAIYTEPPGSQSQWNQQTANILRNSAILLMANGKTLTDLPVLLSDNDFRDLMLETVERMKSERSEYTTLLEAWGNYKRLARTDQWINWIEPILNRVQPMLGDPRIRPILTQVKGELNLRKIMCDQKVLLVKIPQGQLDQNANLLGSLIVTGIKQAALSLSMRGKDNHGPCALYLDEFDTFIEKETFDTITSETKKFKIGFCGAAKTLQILPEDYRNQIIINVGTIAVFALAKKDGDMLGPQMFRVDGRKVKHQTIQNFFNKVNTSPQFELISDEEKLNIDRVVGQEERTYFCYRVGTVAGVFHMKSPDFKDVPDKDVNWDIVDEVYGNRQKKDQAGKRKSVRHEEDDEEDDDDDND